MAKIVSSSNLCLHCSSHLSCSSSKKQSSASMIGFSTSVPRFESLKSSFHGRQVVVSEHQTKSNSQNPKLQVQMSLCIGKANKWWEKGVQPNMKEIKSAEDLVDSLLNAENKLVIVDFFSPGCGGCKALHPKICQFAEMNPDVQFLQVNHEEHKSMCYSLNVHVLPFFRFYRGAQGRLCSFSCTNATIKKFRDALAKHGTDRCSLGPAKGLEESELMALSANRDLCFSYPRKGVAVPAMDPQDLAPVTTKSSASWIHKATQDSEEQELLAAGR